jgi:hypothetical protein
MGGVYGSICRKIAKPQRRRRQGQATGFVAQYRRCISDGEYCVAMHQQSLIPTERLQLQVILENSRVYRSILEYMGVYGSIWEYIGVYGSILEYMVVRVMHGATHLLSLVSRSDESPQIRQVFSSAAHPEVDVSPRVHETRVRLVLRLAGSSVRAPYGGPVVI